MTGNACAPAAPSASVAANRQVEVRRRRMAASRLGTLTSDIGGNPSEKWRTVVGKHQMDFIAGVVGGPSRPLALTATTVKYQTPGSSAEKSYDVVVAPEMRTL